MPVITVQGVSGVQSSLLLDLKRDLQSAVAGIKALELKPEQVTVFFPVDALLEHGQIAARDIIVTIDGLYEHPKRTSTVRNTLALACVVVVRKVFKTELVECFVHTVQSSDRCSVIPKNQKCPLCKICGEQMVDQGSTYNCPNCGNAEPVPGLFVL